MTSNRITGTFDVTLQPQTEPDAADAPAGAPTLGRIRIAKRYHGALDASASGQMLSAMTPTPGSAGYVAIEQVSGTLDGRDGGFVLQHSGLMDRGTPQLTVVVVPDSGTGALAGLSGRMAIRIEQGRHFYDFDYTLPQP